MWPLRSVPATLLLLVCTIGLTAVVTHLLQLRADNHGGKRCATFATITFAVGAVECVTPTVAGVGPPFFFSLSLPDTSRVARVPSQFWFLGA